MKPVAYLVVDSGEVELQIADDAPRVLHEVAEVFAKLLRDRPDLVARFAARGTKSPPM